MDETLARTWNLKSDNMGKMLEFNAVSIGDGSLPFNVIKQTHGPRYSENGISENIMLNREISNEYLGRFYGESYHS